MARSETVIANENITKGNISKNAKDSDIPIGDLFEANAFGTATSELGQWDSNNGEARKVQIVGTLAYVASYYGGLIIIDISTPSAPTILGSYENEERAYDVEVVDDYTCRLHTGKYGYPASAYILLASFLPILSASIPPGNWNRILLVFCIVARKPTIIRPRKPVGM